MTTVGQTGAVAPAGSTAAPKSAVANKGFRKTKHHHKPPPSTPSSTQAASSGLSAQKALGQLIIAPITVGVGPSPTLLSAIRAGQVGGVILFGTHLAPTAVSALTAQLQAEARAGPNPGLLIMTDQEGVGVERISGPPSLDAAHMSDPVVASNQGALAGQLLQSAGVNVDLAPVADVVRNSTGFIAQYGRSFGHTPAAVASAACAFAHGLSHSNVAYTLKHFPGLGDAGSVSTDTAPVTIHLTTSEIFADDLPYRECGHGSRTLVMVSSASYPGLNVTVPAVLSPTIYGVLSRSNIDAVTISDSFDTPTITQVPHPALTAIRAGLDLLLYGGAESDATAAYAGLLSDMDHGLLSTAQVKNAAAKVLGLKLSLGLLR